jgi:photosystem II stability/assembly factor-like uncharacterized protein
MKRNLVRFMVLPAIFVMAAIMITAVHAQQNGFTETFDDAAMPGWEHSPNAAVVDGVLRIDGAGFAFRPEPWSDFSLNLRARYTDEGFLAINYRAGETGGFIFAFGSEYVSLHREVGGAAVEIGRAPIGIPRGEWTRIGVSLAGGEHTITINDQPALSVSDPYPLPPGGLKLRVEGEAVGEFDDVTLTTIGAVASPQPTTPAQPTIPSTIPAPKGPSTQTGMPAYQVTDPWIRLGGPPGGLGYDIRMRPDNPDIMFVTDAFTGIFKSTDGGQSWSAMNTGIESFPGAGAQIFCATIDPHNYDVVWAGTQFTGHIYHSANNGATWEQRDNGLAFEDCLRSVRGITVDPNDPNIVYAALEVGQSCRPPDDRAHRQEPVTGEVYKSTDGGLNWARIWEGDNLARYIWVDSRNSNRLYVSTGLFDRDAANSDIPEGEWGGVGILRSDDGGQTWTVLDQDNGLGGLYIPSLFMHPDDPDTLVAAVTYPADPGGEGVYVTHDGGNTWEKILGVEQWMGMDAVEIATGNPDVWYAAAESIIYRSDDAGKTWQNFPLKTAVRYGGLPIDLQVDPRDPYRIFQNAYGGGNMMSADGGQTWVEATRGYTGAGIGTLLVPPGPGWTVFANGFHSDDGGVNWNSSVGFPATAFAMPASADGSTPRLLATSAGGAFHASADGGTTWEAIPLVDTNETLRPPAAALAVSPSDPQTMYIGWASSVCALRVYRKCFDPQYGLFGLFRSRDGGRSWEQLNTPFARYSITNMAVHPHEAEIVYAGTGQGLYLSRDGGNTWQPVTAVDDAARNAGALNPDLAARPAPVIYDVVFDPFDPQILYVVSEPGPVLRSRDGGATWEQVAIGMDPNEPVADLLPDPNRPGVIYAASKLSGVFVSTDGADTWTSLVNGLERKDAQVLALSQDGTVLYLGTASGTGGAGVWRLGTPAGLPTAEVTQPAAQVLAASSTETPSAKPGICGSASILPLALVGLARWRRRRQEEMES